jgi:hypothetical protein
MPALATALTATDYTTLEATDYTALETGDQTADLSTITTTVQTADETAQ